jgi:hypothetical protein
MRILHALCNNAIIYTGALLAPSCRRSAASRQVYVGRILGLQQVGTTSLPVLNLARLQCRENKSSRVLIETPHLLSLQVP